MISYIQNSHLRNRRAAVDVTPEVIAEAIPVLVDAGFRIVGSASTRGMQLDIVRLIIEGDALPEECSSEMRLISITFQAEQYGKQRIVRVAEVTLVKNAPAIAA